MTVELVALAAAGLAAGYVNAIAGGGSFLTLPALIFTGLDAGAANATNRVGVFVQNVSIAVALARGGLRFGSTPWLVCLPAAVSTALGAWTATLVPETAMRLVIATVMVLFLGFSIHSWRKVDRGEARTKTGGAPLGPIPFRPTMTVGFFLLGFYVGFLQAGMGIAVLLYLALAYDEHMVAANGVKVILNLALNVVALAVFAYRGETIDLARGVLLAAATALGGYIGVRHALHRGERFVRGFVVLIVIASASKLAWDSL